MRGARVCAHGCMPLRVSTRSILARERAESKEREEWERKALAMVRATVAKNRLLDGLSPTRVDGVVLGKYMRVKKARVPFEPPADGGIRKRRAENAFAPRAAADAPPRRDAPTESTAATALPNGFAVDHAPFRALANHPLVEKQVGQPVWRVALPPDGYGPNQFATFSSKVAAVNFSHLVMAPVLCATPSATAVADQVETHHPEDFDPRGIVCTTQELMEAIEAVDGLNDDALVTIDASLATDDPFPESLLSPSAPSSPPSPPSPPSTPVRCHSTPHRLPPESLVCTDETIDDAESAESAESAVARKTTPSCDNAVDDEFCDRRTSFRKVLFRRVSINPDSWRASTNLSLTYRDWENFPMRVCLQTATLPIGTRRLRRRQPPAKDKQAPQRRKTPRPTPPTLPTPPSARPPPSPLAPLPLGAWLPLLCEETL